MVVKDEFWIQKPYSKFDLDFVKSIVENDDSQIFVIPNNVKNFVMLAGAGRGQKKASRGDHPVVY